MEKKARVLGYHLSKELTYEELQKVAGGTAKLTCQTTQQGTGCYPGNVDMIVDQQWD